MIEIDGPPQGYFDFKDSFGKDHRLIFRTFGLGGTNPHLIVKAMNQTLNLIRDYLGKIPDSILYWRRRPCITLQDGVYYITCRLITEPDLPVELLGLLKTKEEGQEFAMEEESPYRALNDPTHP